MGLEASEGQAEFAPESGQAEAAPQTSGEQPVTSSQTTSSGPDVEAIESFFDPKSIEGKPELQSAYKQMQGEFTKRLQGIKANQAKIDAYEAFERDPHGTIRQIAQQYGFNMVQSDPKSKDDWQPKTWDDVLERARDEVRKEFEPITNEVRSLKRKNVESYLDSQHPDWRTYESSMVDLLKAHPSMANDPDTLYRLSVPPEVLEARATKQALAKLKGEGQNARLSGNKTTSVPTTTEPTGPLSLADAVKVAKDRLTAKGVSGPVVN